MSLGLAERYPLTSCVNRHLFPLQQNGRKHGEAQARRTLNQIHKLRPQQLSSTSQVRLALSGTASPYSVPSVFSSPPAPASCAGPRSCGVPLLEFARFGRRRWFLSVVQEKHDLCSLRLHRRLGGSGSVTKWRILWNVSRMSKK